MILLHILKRIVSICKLKLKTTLEQEHKLISDQPVYGSNLREQYFFISPYLGTERERERESCHCQGSKKKGRDLSLIAGIISANTCANILLRSLQNRNDHWLY
jgi:hypothetical protein